MLFSIPSFPRYLQGLSIIALLSIILYFIYPSLGISGTASYIGVIAGLVIGHLIGSFTSQPSSTTEVIPEEIKTIYVGNIAYSTNRKELEGLFSQYGTVHSTRLMTDKQTRKPRGYGFVEMESDAANKAIAALNGNEFKGRNLKVSEAKDRK